MSSVSNDDGPMSSQIFVHFGTCTRQMFAGMTNYRIGPHQTTSDRIGSHLIKLSRDVCNGHVPPVYQ